MCLNPDQIRRLTICMLHFSLLVHEVTGGVFVRRLCWYIPVWALACNRPAVQQALDVTDSGGSLHTGVILGDSGTLVDSGEADDTGAGIEDEMIKGIFAPMMLDPELHDFDDPQTIADMGFNTVGLLQYILVGPDGVVMEGWTDEEITDVVRGFQAVGLDVSLGLGMGYSKTGDIDDLLRVTNYPAEGVEPGPVLEVLGDYFLSMVPLAEELDIAIFETWISGVWGFSGLLDRADRSFSSS